MSGKTSLVQMCGYGVNVETAGEAGPILIVLLHGFGAGNFSWKPVFEPLTHLGQVVAYDRPGFGYTEYPFEHKGTNPFGLEGQLELLSAVIAKYRQNRPVVLIGHSAGGQIAAEFAVRNPGEIRALILESPAIMAAGGPPPLATTVLRAKAFDRIGPKLVAKLMRLGDKLLIASWFDKSKILPETLATYAAPQARHDAARAFFEFVRAPKKSTIQKRLAELNLPVFVISGDRDQVVKVESTFKVTEQIPGHKIYLVPNCGHIAHEEKPEDFLRVVTNFLRATS
jgi:pimeloyl-ACP methyl ester carboxylesterase